MRERQRERERERERKGGEVREEGRREERDVNVGRKEKEGKKAGGRLLYSGRRLSCPHTPAHSRNCDSCNEPSFAAKLLRACGFSFL